MLLKKILSFIFAVFTAFSAAAIGEETPIAEYTLAGLDGTQYRNWETSAFFERLEEATGVSFVYKQYTDASQWKQAKEKMEADSLDLPDVLFKAALTGAECVELREKGVLIDLKPYLQDNCPNLWAILAEHPDYLDAITLPDGSIAALPYISVPPMQNYMWINREWLNQLNLQEPATAQDLVDVLTAFKTRDPNRNGKKDEIPLGFLGPFDLKFLAHAFGLVANDYNVFVSEGRVKFMPLEDDFRLFVTWCRDLYSAGLLDKNGFSTTDSLRTVTDSKAQPTYGIIITSMAADLFPVSWADSYDIMMPLSYGGRQIYRDFSGPVFRGTFAVTSACKNPEAMLRWVDYFYTEEGAILSSIGQENTDYLVDGDGTWRFVDGIQSNYDLYRAESLMDGDTQRPGIVALAFQQRMSGNAAIQRILEEQKEFDAFTLRPYPYFLLTAEQEEQIASLQVKIGYYVDMQIARWVLGEEEISDESFAAFSDALCEMGLEEFIDFWQDVLDRLS